jgi:APA family basic amino acid/polyamine antiporter
MIKPKLTFFDLTMIVVSLVIGIGIFRTPTIVAQKAGTPQIFFAVWILGGIVSILGALTFAEIGSRLPAAGGFYKIFSHCYHPAFAFMLNWSLVITNAASAVGVALVGAEYIAPVLLPVSMQNDGNVKIIAVVVTLILFSLNYLGIKAGARTQNFLSVLKIVMILVFCLAVFGNHRGEAPMMVNAPDFNWLSAIGVSLISVFFTYGGYQSTINFGADIQNPQRNIPRSIFAGMLIVISLYLLINVAYYTVLGFDGIKNSKLLASDLAQSFMGESGATVTSMVIFISVLGFINTSLMNNPRMYYAMADDKILPEIFKRVNSKTMAQEFALSFFVALMLISLFLLGTFEKIVNYVMFIDSLSLVTAAGTIFILRSRAKRSAEEHSGFKIRWFPLVPLLFMFVLLMVTVNVLISDLQAALRGFSIFILGFPLFHLLKRLISK